VSILNKSSDYHFDTFKIITEPAIKIEHLKHIRAIDQLNHLLNYELMHI